MKITCDSCGNEYEGAFQVSMHGKNYTFDAFECAINKLAPKCAHCGTKIVGHGVEDKDLKFCCAHCARAKGIHTLKDQAS